MQEQKNPNLVYGTMCDTQLNVGQLLEYGAKYNGNQEIVTRSIEGPIHRETFKEALVRSKQLTQALQKYGIKMSDRVGSIAFNTYRHFEVYYGVQGMGAILNTLNPRLHPEQLTFIVNHAENRILFIDIPFVPLIEKFMSSFKTVEKVVVMTDKAHMPKASSIMDKLICYEEFIGEHDGNVEWPEIDERLGCCLCYTSGTTGNPKGVMYSHRSQVLHALRFITGFALPIKQTDTMLAVVPLFHVNCWGLAYSCVMSGFKMVFPGADMSGGAVYELIDKENVNITAGVPTVWNMLLNHCEQNKLVLSKLKTVIIGGAAVPRSMIQKFWDQHNIDVIQGWGMTETSPLGVVTRFDEREQKLPIDQRFDLIQKGGKVCYGCELRIVDDNENELPQDGKTQGHLWVRGFVVSNGYYKDDRKEAFKKDGWFATGDMCTITPEGWMTITDRSKDVIKSGGEWISSLDLENAAMGHPKIFEACVIGMPHPKFDERPLLFVVKKNADEELTFDEVKQFLTGKVAKWWLPNDMKIIDAIPKNATGKFWKMKLREQFKDYKFPEGA